MIQTARPLTRILGLGFGLAMVFGGTVGVGILRLPGTLAAALGDSRLIVLFWILGGLYSLLGAVAVAELAAMLPEAGGFYVYARRAFGNGTGATNALPQRARANINCRIFPGEAIEDVRQTLARVLADPEISVITSEPSYPVVLPPPLTAAIMKPIEQVTHRIYPGIEVVPVLQAAGTDAVYFSESGIPTYGISGMFVDPDLGNVHGLNERIRVQSLYDGRDFLFSLVKLYAEQVR
jgi:acetylornithine deacetylase/succinyl-diaminopimelate desuccinylase-like protein